VSGDPGVSEAPVAVGWLGAGRMGVPMAERLIAAGHQLIVWNRTPGRLEGLVRSGARAVEHPAQVAAAPVVFSMVADDTALDALSAGGGLFAPDGSHRPPRIWLDCSTVSVAASERAAAAASDRGTAFLAAPVSGNPGVVRTGNLIFAVSGPCEAYVEVEPLLAAIGRRSYYLGGGHEARTVKLCTNLLVAVIAQALAEAVVLAERSGVSRSSMLEFVNDSAVGSAFTKYKGQAFIDLDFTPTFTPEGQRKDVRLALAQAASLEVPMPLASATEVALSRLVGSGLGEGRDFGALLLQVARDAGITLQEGDP